MTKISLLEMGKTKKRNVRETILSVLSAEFPLSIKKIFNKVKKEHNLDVTYQAVFKIINELLEDNVLEKTDKEYKLNMLWIKDLENELNVIKKNYMGESNLQINEGRDFNESVNSFVSKIGPKIKEYIGDDETCILGVGGTGLSHAMSLWKYLLKEGKKVAFLELDKTSLIKDGILKFNKRDFENKKVLIVDYAIFSGTVFRFISPKINSLKKSLK